MMTLVLLTGCSRGGQGASRSAEELALSIRAEYLAMTACTASVDITADYGQRVYEYSVNISWQKGGETVLTITAPENIAGITAHIQDGNSYLEYDGASLETGLISDAGLSPIEVVPAALNYILSGYIAASQVSGIRSEGVYVYMKHAILNEQEKNREGVNTWCNEQAIRQIYARPFQITIEEAGAENLMTGFNRIGVQWTSQQGFINNVFRDEFGMMGFAVSDFWQNGYMNLTGGILGGSALPDGDTANSADASELYAFKKGYGNLAWAMREEAHRILYVVVNSVAMNGYSASTKFLVITPQWVKLLSGVKTGVTVSFCLSVVLFAVTSVLYEREKKQRATKKKAE